MRTRRDHDRVIDLIASICFLRQYQKQVTERNGIEYIECDIEDYKIAKRIINGVLQSTLFELPSSAIDFYEEVRNYVRKQAKKKDLSVTDFSITQRELREFTGFVLMNPSQTLIL